MQVRETTLPGALLIEPAVFPDDRGFFVETYREGVLAEAGITDALVRATSQIARRLLDLPPEEA